MIKNSKKSFYWLVGLMLACFTIASVFQALYLYSPDKDLDINAFQNTLNHKIRFADKELETFKANYLLNKTPSKIESNYDDISYYVYKNDSLVFWSENEIDIPQIFQGFDSKTAFVEIQHNECVYRTLSKKNYRFVALVRIKNNYTEPNNYLQNEFESEFALDKQIQILSGNSSDKYAVFSPEKEYLFSLKKDNSKLFNHPLSVWSMAFWILGLIIAYVLSKRIYIVLGNNISKPKLNAYSFLFWAILIYIGIYLNEPWMMFLQDYFSPIHYASGEILASMGHLTLISVFLLSEIIIFYSQAEIKPLDANLKRKNLYILALNLASVLVFALIINLIQNLVNNSSFDIRLYILENVSFITFIAITLILSWLTGFWLLRLKALAIMGQVVSFKTTFLFNLAVAAFFALLCFVCCPQYAFTAAWYLVICSCIDYIYYKQYPIFSIGNVSLLLILLTLFEVHYSVILYSQKTQNKMKTLAENMESGETMERNLFAEILFEELNEDLYEDDMLLEVSNKKDSVESEMQTYLMKNYFRGFWNNYNIKTYLFDQEHPGKTDLEKLAFYKKLLKKTERIKKTNFYFCGNEDLKIDYIGVFDLHNEILYIELYSKQRTVSYSYPEPLLRAEKYNLLTNGISMGRYLKNKLSSQMGDLSYPSNENWIGENKSSFYYIDKWDFRHYIYKPSANTSFVISKQKNGFYAVYIVYGAYLFAIYFGLTVLIFTLLRGLKWSDKKRHSFLSRLQLAFIFLLIFSFVSIFVISISYIINQYEKKQNIELQNKTRYIRQYLGETLKQARSLKQINVIELNFLLQELSKTYETDIHIYDDHGSLLASSQPIIFAKGLLSYRMSPKPFFEQQNEQTLHEKIGKFQYLSAYTQLYNQRNKLLGYIAVPSFLSSGEIRKEIFSLLAVIINVYLFIIFVAILVSFFVSKQLSRPIKDLEQKLKTISLKGNNEKLEYKHNDEIGQLVDQYNLMVEQLEKSAEKLAQSERETAWKQMARQVTHEIKNPLTPMKLTIQQLQRMQGMDNEAFNQYFKKSSLLLVEQIDHLSSIATAFSDFAKMPEAQHERINVMARMERTIELFKNNHEQVDIKLQMPAEEYFILADKEQLTQIFNNLIKNAIQAIPAWKEGLVEIACVIKNKHIIIEIKDNGTGISPEIQDKLFTPNFTTKNSGMGLGLAIVKNIVTSNQGKIWFSTKLHQGTSFFLEFTLL